MVYKKVYQRFIINALKACSEHSEGIHANQLLVIR